jgi:glycosyltransferase involved in cell wall biosynthesis
VLQLSAVHVYLTYPFVLSWSLLEALSAGCLVIASRTPPVEEVMTDRENGYLVDFFDIDGLAGRIAEALAQPRGKRQSRIRAAARDTVIRGYDLNRVCLPAYLSLLQKVTGKPVCVAAPP